MSKAASTIAFRAAHCQRAKGQPPTTWNRPPTNSSRTRGARYNNLNPLEETLMAPTLTLPRADGTLARYTLSGQSPIVPPSGPIKSRVGMAAVHVVADPL